MPRSALLLILAASLLASPAFAGDDTDDDPPPEITAGYVVGGVLVGTGVATGIVAFTQWAGLIGVQNDLYTGGRPAAELDQLIEDGNGYMLRGIVFTSIAGVTAVSGLITLGSTSDRHRAWKDEQSQALLHRRRPRLVGVAAAPAPGGGFAQLEVQW